MNQTISNSLKLGAAALAAFLFVGLDSNAAHAAYGYGGFGIHIGGRNVRLDIGSPQTRYYPQANQAAYRRSYSNPQNYGRSCDARSRASRAQHRWHDTSHWDHTPARVVPHGNHYDYIPARTVWHQEGHWDRHNGRHHDGRHHDGRHHDARHHDGKHRGGRH